MTQQIVFKPLGLVTQPSPVALEPGAMFTAIGMYIRSPGLIENAFGWKDAAVTPTATGNVQIITPLGDQYLLIYPDTATPTSSSTWSYRWNLQTTGVLQGSPASMVDEDAQPVNIDETARFSRITMRNRTLVCGKYGVLAWDSTSPASAADRTPRRAGLMPPIMQGAFDPGSLGTAVPLTYACHVTAVLRRKYADGYELVSAPTPAAYFSTFTGGPAVSNLFIQIRFRVNYARVGDIVEIYRTRAQIYTPVASRINTGADFYLSTSYTLTASDIAAVNITDTAPDANLGEALYTNTGVQGADSAALPPPTCKSMAVFKGYAFFGNRTDPPSYAFRVPTLWGQMGTTASGGANAAIRRSSIGLRSVVGTSTTSSAVITAVSAADIIGLKVGQAMNSPAGGFGGPTILITAIGATTVTVSVTSSLGAAGVEFVFADVISVNGQLTSITTVTDLAFVLPTKNVYSYGLDRVYGISIGSVYLPETVPADKTILSMLFESGASGSSLVIKSTNGANFVPPLPEMSATAQTFTHTPVLNGLSWSELNQPENCPPLNTAFVGSGEIYAMAATRDALWIFASDGLWRLSGTGGVAGSGYDWRIDPVDSTLIISGPQAFAVLRDTVYAYTNRGLVSIDSSGNVAEVSNGRIGDFLPGPMWSTPIWSPTSCIWMAADETNDEILLKESGIPAYFYRYNILTDTLVQDTSSSGATNTSHGVYSRTLELPITALSTGLTRTVNTAVRVGFTIVYRFVFAKSFFTQKHWRVVDLSISSTGGSSVIEVFCNNVTCGVRTLPSRTGYTVARNCPAVSNTLELKLVSDPLAATPGVRTRLQAVAVKYDEFTEQRKVR